MSPPSRLKDMLIAGLACATLALALLAWHQRTEMNRLAGPRQIERPAATVTIHRASVRNVALVPPRSSAHFSEELRAAAEANDLVGPVRPEPEARPRRRSALSRLVENPEFLEALGLHRQAMLDARFADLFRRLNLTTEELAAFKRLLADKENAVLDVVAISESLPDGPLSPETLRAGVRAAQAQLEEAIQNSLGRERYAMYRDYERTLAHRETVAQLGQRLSYSAAPLTPAQADSLVQIFVASAPPDNTGSAAVSIVLAASGTTVPILQATAPAGRVTDEAVAQSQAVLEPAQLAALRDLQLEQQAAARAAELVRQSTPAVNEAAGIGLSLFLQ